MSTETAELFFGLLAVTAGVGAIALVILRIATAAGSDGARQLGSSISDAAVWLAFLVAATSTFGSLYFSEVANFAPCRMCWFQRIAMYPLSVILFVGAIRRDRGVRWYAGPLAAIGLAVSSYHSLIEWRPALDTGSCDATGPSCSIVWFRMFGLSLANFAWIGFLTILILLFVRFPARLPEPPAVGSSTEPMNAPSDDREMETLP